MIKINNKVNFVYLYFLIRRGKPPNMQTECKCVVDFQCFRVDNFPNKEYPQKQENLNNSSFFVVELRKI